MPGACIRGTQKLPPLFAAIHTTPSRASGHKLSCQADDQRPKSLVQDEFTFAAPELALQELQQMKQAGVPSGRPVWCGLQQPGA
jgi:hypothetical protein